MTLIKYLRRYFDNTTMKVNRLEQTSYELQTVVLRGNSTAADNIRLKEILKRRLCPVIKQWCI